MGHNHGHKTKDKSGRNILIAFYLNASFSIIELIGGFYTNSMAIMSDALHDFGDSLALLFAYFAEKFSQKEADEKFSFGYRRFSVLAAFINGAILLIGSSYVLFESFQRVFHPEAVKPEGMMALAVLGILVNGVAAYKLSHTEGMNAKMVSLHLLEDLFGWIAVLIVSIILIFKPWYILDSILSILISIIILKGVFKNFKQIGNIFLQRFPENLDVPELKKDLLSLNLVNDVHGLKAWSIDEDSFYLRLHILVPKGTQVEELDRIREEAKIIFSRFSIKYSSVEFESETKGDC